MNLDGHVIGAAAFAVCYMLLWAAYFARFIKKYPKDRGIRFGSIAAFILICALAIFRLPGFGKIQEWVIPIFFITELPLVCLSLFYLVKETVMDFRKSGEKKHNS